MQPVFSQDEISNAFKNTDPSMIGKALYNLGGFIPASAAGEAAPEMIAEKLPWNSILNALKNAKAALPKNAAIGGTYSASQGDNPIEGAAFQSVALPAGEFGLGMAGKFFSSGKEKAAQVLQKYADLLGDYMGKDLEALNDNIINGIKKNINKMKSAMSGLYKDAIGKSDEAGGKMAVDNLNQAAQEKIQEIMDEYGFTQLGLNNIDMDTMSTEDKNLFKKLRTYMNKQPMSYNAADKLRQKLRKSMKGSDPISNDVMRSLYGAINQDFEDSEMGDLWKDVRKQYADYAQKTKENQITKAVGENKSPDKVVDAIIKYSGNPEGLANLITDDIKPDLEQKVIEQLGMTSTGDYSLNQMLNKYQKMAASEPKKTRSIFTSETMSKLNDMLKDRALNKSAYDALSAKTLTPSYIQSVNNQTAGKNVTFSTLANVLGHGIHLGGAASLTGGMAPAVIKAVQSMLSKGKEPKLENIQDVINKYLSKQKSGSKMSTDQIKSYLGTQLNQAVNNG